MSKLKCFVLEDEIDQLPRSVIREVLKDHMVTYAKSRQDAEGKYEGGYDLLLLDHDMEGNYEYRPEYPNTGMQFCKWLVKGLTPGRSADRPAVLLHSHNAVGRKNMRLLLEEYGFVVGEFAFSSQYVNKLRDVLKTLE